MLFNDPAILVRVCLGYKRSVHLRQSFLAPSAKEKGDANVRIQELEGRVLPPADSLYIYITYIIHLYITAMNIVDIYISCSRYVSTRPFVWGGDFVLPAVMLKMIR